MLERKRKRSVQDQPDAQYVERKRSKPGALAKYAGVPLLKAAEGYQGAYDLVTTPVRLLHRGLYNALSKVASYAGVESPDYDKAVGAISDAKMAGMPSDVAKKLGPAYTKADNTAQNALYRGSKALGSIAAFGLGGIRNLLAIRPAIGFASAVGLGAGAEQLTGSPLTGDIVELATNLHNAGFTLPKIAQKIKQLASSRPDKAIAELAKKGIEVSERTINDIQGYVKKYSPSDIKRHISQYGKTLVEKATNQAKDLYDKVGPILRKEGKNKLVQTNGLNALEKQLRDQVKKGMGDDVASKKIANKILSRIVKARKNKDVPGEVLSESLVTPSGEAAKVPTNVPEIDMVNMSIDDLYEMSRDLNELQKSLPKDSQAIPIIGAVRGKVYEGIKQGGTKYPELKEPIDDLLGANAIWTAKNRWNGKNIKDLTPNEIEAFKKLKADNPSVAQALDNAVEGNIVENAGNRLSKGAKSQTMADEARALAEKHPEIEEQLLATISEGNSKAILGKAKEANKVYKDTENLMYKLQAGHELTPSDNALLSKINNMHPELNLGKYLKDQNIGHQIEQIIPGGEAPKAFSGISSAIPGHKIVNKGIGLLERPIAHGKAIAQGYKIPGVAEKIAEEAIYDTSKSTPALNEILKALGL